MKAITGLLQSRKAMLVMGIVITLTVLLALGKLDQDHYEAMIKFIMPSWLGAHAWEEGKKAEGGKKALDAAIELVKKALGGETAKDEPEVDEAAEDES